MTRKQRFSGILFPSLFLLACSSGGSSVPGEDTDVALDPGTELKLSLGTKASTQKKALDLELGQLEDMDAEGFAKATQVDFEELGYDPSEAIGLDLIESSELGLTQKEKDKLTENGFVISRRNQFPTFSYGLSSIYADDLPLYVTADSILTALHTSYDNILKAFEGQSLLPALTRLTSGLRAELERSDYEGDLRDDLDVFLTVAESLLVDQEKSALHSSNQSEVSSLFSGCKSAEGVTSVQLFGVTRRLDFSQCEPRGHYTDSENLERYFRAMMWLGRIDFRMIETQEDGSSVFRRRQLEAAWALRALLTGELLSDYQAVDDFVTTFVGEHDYMTVAQFASLAEDLGVGKLDELDAKSDETIAQAIVDGGYGTQRISSHYMVNGMGSGTLPLSSSFALFGQRYVIDSHVFSNVVFDRVAKGAVKRMMPKPLDVAYAALGNDQAGMLLQDELEDFPYAADLKAMRVIADSEPSSFWAQNLYNRWLGALRTLSPSSSLSTEDEEALPSIFKTEAWGARLLNTQLASWAELRHDTILYVKQSYTGGASCEFPDAYVDPYPAFYGALGDYAAHALSVIENLGFEPPSGVADYFDHFDGVMGTLREMAEHQRTGTPHSEEHMAFINQAVSLVVNGCAGPDGAEGWYPELIYGNPVEWAPTIADVHTQPTDEGGSEVGRILHVGTGNVNMMVTTVETCSGPRAYSGLVSTYYELIEEDWKRLTDPEWEQILREGAPSSPNWVESLTVE